MPIRISITGVLGSGKSAVCKELEKYKLKYFSTGVIQRGIAVKMGMSTFELNEYSETHPEIDELIDSELRKLSDSPEDAVIDSRMAWHFVKNTFKVFLWADETVAAKRIMSHDRGLSEKYEDAETAKSCLKARKHSENIRFCEKYGVDCGNLLNYDLIIDTTDALPEFIAGIIMDKCLHRNPDVKGPVFLISARCLYPTLAVKNLSRVEEAAGEPVKAAYSGGYFFIHDLAGHRRVGALCQSDKPRLVNCELAAQIADITGSVLSTEEIKTWEELNGFKYETYPYSL